MGEKEIVLIPPEDFFEMAELLPEEAGRIGIAPCNCQCANARGYVA